MKTLKIEIYSIFWKIKSDLWDSKNRSYKHDILQRDRKHSQILYIDPRDGIVSWMDIRSKNDKKDLSVLWVWNRLQKRWDVKE